MRDQTIDNARGIAIIAIVLGHVVRGLGDSGILSDSSAAYALTDRGLYLVHLSVFALLSGLFVKRGIDRSGGWPYLRSRAALFLYLYVLWSLLQGFVKLAAGSVSSNPVSLVEVLSLWRSETQMWFLPFLVVATAVVVLVRPWARVWGIPYFGAIVVAAISVLIWGWSGPVIGTQGLALLGFFVVGAATTYERLNRMVEAISPPWLVVGFVVLGGVYAGTLLTMTPTPPAMLGTPADEWERAAGLVASVTGCVAVILLAAILARLRTPLLPAIGRRSLEIFLAHVIAFNVVRIGLGLLDVTNDTVNIVLCTVAGVALPMLLAALSDRVRPLRWLFELPRVRKPQPAVSTPGA
ncbi:acyltransferase family protein [Microbacterium sp. P5_E9]